MSTPGIGSSRRVVQFGLVFALLAVTGCGAGTGTLSPPPQQQLALIDAGLDELAASGMIQYEGTQPGIHPQAEEPSDVSWQVLSDGTALGRANIGGYDCEILAIGDLEYAKSESQFWEEKQELNTDQAKKIDDNWVQVYNQQWISPGTFLTPEVYAETLRANMAANGDFDSPLPNPVDVDGQQAYPIQLGDGTVYFSTEDGSILRIDDATVEELAETSLSITATVNTGEPTTTELDALDDDITDDLDHMEQVVYLETRTDSVAPDDIGIECDSPTTCTIDAKVSVDDYGDNDDDYKVMVTFTGTATINYDGDESECTATKTIPLGDSKHMSCKATLHSPTNESDQIYGDAQTQGDLAVIEPDIEALTKQVDTTIDEITEETGD